MKWNLSCFVFFFVWICLSNNKSFGQNQFNIHIEMPTCFEGDSLNIDINNIFENKSYKLKIKNKVVNLKGVMKTKYSSAYIYLTKDSASIDTSFYFGQKPFQLICEPNDTSKKPFLRSKVINACFQNIIDNLYGSIEDEYQKYMYSYREFKFSNIQSKDSLKIIFLHNREIYRNKILLFIEMNPNSYFSLDYFNSYFVNRANFSNADSLLKFFYKVFPKTRIHSKEGKQISKYLISKRQIVEGAYSPNFISKDFNGNIKKFSYKDLADNYTLLQFWASWCVPCIREIPAIKNIKEKYPKEKLRIISVSIDIDSNKWKSAVNRYKLDWENFNDLDIQKKFGITSIPAIYLISPTGSIVYSSAQREDNDNLEKLSELLQQLIR